MKLDFDFKFKEKLFGNRRGAQASDGQISTQIFQDAYYDPAAYLGEVGFAHLQPLNSPARQAVSRWSCFPRRRRSQPVLLDAPTYEEALELDSKNPTRVVRNRVLRKFPKGKPKGQVAEDGCRICLSEFPEETAELPCKHIFCKECINKWLGSQRTCPVCRYEFSDAHTKLIIPK